MVMLATTPTWTIFRMLNEREDKYGLVANIQARNATNTLRESLQPGLVRELTPPSALLTSSVTVTGAPTS